MDFSLWFTHSRNSKKAVLLVLLEKLKLSPAGNQAIINTRCLLESALAEPLPSDTGKFIQALADWLQAEAAYGLDQIGANSEKAS